MNSFKKIFPDPLILYLVIALFAAYFFPQLSLINFKDITLDTIIEFGVIVVFFFYGLKLKWNEVFKDILNWKSHLCIQLTTFLVFPIIGLLFYPLILLGQSYFILFLAIFYLCTLPSTVSSSVVMVSIAKGNVTSAIFNASLSGLLGIIITPLWMSIFVDFNSDSNSYSIIIDLIIKVLLPVFVGALLQPYLGKLYDKYKSTLSNIDKITIVLIVYNSFSHTFLSGIFSEIGFSNIVLTIAIVILIFLVVYYLIEWINSKWLKFSTPDFITVQFCGTKKSLVHGSVMGSVLFADQIGIYLLPIMIFHTFQLLFISYKASIYAKKEV